MVVLSKEKAAHKQNWDKILTVFHDGGLIKGKVKAVVKGGLMVNIGVEAFLPGSQIDIIPPKDLNEYVGNTYDFKIVKINDDRKNIVLSAAAKSSRRSAPNSARSSSTPSSPATRSRASSRTSPTSARSSTSTAWTACSTSPT